jgi:hypothetical protein
MEFRSLDRLYYFLKIFDCLSSTNDLFLFAGRELLMVMRWMYKDDISD